MTTTFDWSHKAKALNALSPISIQIATNGSWYVSQGVHIKQGAVLAGCVGRGDTPVAAIEDHWQQAVNGLKPGEYLIFDEHGDRRRAAKWNGFMWQEVKEADKAA